MMIGYWPQLIYDASNILLSTFYEFASPCKNSEGQTVPTANSKMRTQRLTKV